MFLHRLHLNPRSKEARRDLASPYDMHRTLVRAFVDDDKQSPPRFLWRLEASSTWSDPVVLVQSAYVADWSKLDAINGYQKKLAETKTVSLEKLLQAGAHYRFRLVANPTVTRDGKRYGLAAEDAQLSWLARQGERLGFRVETVVVTASDMVKGRKGEMNISLQRVCYEGILQAIDVSKLGEALPSGIGPAKSFGCGLLSLAPI